MELFNWINVVQFFMQYVFGYTPDSALTAEENMQLYIGSYRNVMLISVAVAAAVYLVCLILGGIGMHVMAKKRNMKHSFLAFLPFANTYYAGKLAGDCKIFGKKVKHMGLITMLAEIVYVAASVFSLVMFFGVLRPEHYEVVLSSSGAFDGAKFQINKMPVALRWMVSAKTVSEILTSVFSFVLFFCMVVLFNSFYRKYYARSPFVMTILSAFLPLRGIVIFAVRNNTPIDYDAWMRRQMEEMARRQQQMNMGGYGGYPGGNYPGGNYPGGNYSGGNAPSDKPEEPFSDFGGSDSSESRGNSDEGSPFSDF